MSAPGDRKNYFLNSLSDELNANLMLYVMPLSPEYVEHQSAIEEHQILMASGSLPTYPQLLRRARNNCGLLHTLPFPKLCAR